MIGQLWSRIITSSAQVERVPTRVLPKYLRALDSIKSFLTPTSCTTANAAHFFSHPVTCIKSSILCFRCDDDVSHTELEEVSRKSRRATEAIIDIFDPHLKSMRKLRLSFEANFINFHKKAISSCRSCLSGYVAEDDIW